MNSLEAIASASVWRQPPIVIVANVVTMVTFVVIAAAVVIDFRKYQWQQRTVLRSDRSVVETGTMTLFFVVYYLVVRFGILMLAVPEPARSALMAAGIVLLVVGTWFNVWGRLVLKGGWANQIKIYEGHELVSTGPFAVVRHPLYASLVWIFIGGAAIYANPLALLLALGVFVPMMYVRAKKEDALLHEAFGERYDEYRARTGMFFPKLWRRA